MSRFKKFNKIHLNLFFEEKDDEECSSRLISIKGSSLLNFR